MDEKYMEQAAAITEMQRDTAQHSAQAAVGGAGQADCEDCGQPIPPARRVAYPAAVRCFFCQSEHEGRRRLFPVGG